MSSSATKSRRGFTLVEMLVVVGIIAVLLSIAVPVSISAYKKSLRTRMALDLQTLGNALEAYKADFRDYPRLGTTTPQPTGAALLCWALVGPGPATQDGVDGFGFNIRAGGQKYGPYIQIDQFKISNTLAPPVAPPAPLDDTTATLNDRYNHPILYFPANTSADITQMPAPPSGTTPAHGFVSNVAGSYYNPDLSMKFTFDPGMPGSNANFTKAMRVLLGDVNNNGFIDGAETANYKGPYLLWMAGPDEVYGYNGAGNNPKLDDVTNIP